jgi:DNA polymerase III subunit gamma/tau
VALALYRKYRPRTFAEVIGQEHVTEPLMQALRSGRLNHAYLFSGPRGCGKTSSARILARSLNCEKGPTPEPCGACDSCVALAPDGPGSIDVIEIDAASHGGVDDARELRERAFFAPVASRFKVYVIDEAHMVSSAGFNALLKLVEEPPEYVMFVFATTEPEKVLGTIKSRTHHYPFRLIPPGTLRPYLEELCEREGAVVEPPVFPLIVRAGGGSVRDSLSVLDQLIAGGGPEGVTYNRAVALLGVTDAALLDEMCDALAASDGSAAYQAIDRVMEAGHDPRRFASDLLERLRDLIVLQQVRDAIGKGLLDYPADQLERLEAQASRLGLATLTRCAGIVHDGLTEMRGTTAPRLLLEILVARMLLPGADESTGALLQRMERLERRLGAASEGGSAQSAMGRPEPAAPARPVQPVPAAEPARPARAASGPPASQPTDVVQAPAATGPGHAVPPGPGHASSGGTSAGAGAQARGDGPSAGHAAATDQPGGAAGPGPGGFSAWTGSDASDGGGGVPVRSHAADTVTTARGSAPSPADGAPAAGSAVAPARPNAETSGLPAQAATAELAPAGALDAAAIRRVWDDVLTAVRRRSVKDWAVAREATVREVEGTTLVLLFRHQVHATMLSNGPKTLIDAVTELLGGKWDIRCEVPAADLPAQAQPPPAPPVDRAPAQRQPQPARTPNDDWPAAAVPGGGQSGAAATRTATAVAPASTVAPARSAAPVAPSATRAPVAAPPAPQPPPAVAAPSAPATAPQGSARAARPPSEPERATWPEEPPPYETEYGFDPGDEPIDEEPPAVRESSEEQALRLLREHLGAERID